MDTQTIPSGGMVSDDIVSNDMVHQPAVKIKIVKVDDGVKNIV
jgi:hypothetical protein